MQVVEGVFELQMPPVLLGYSQQQQQAPLLSVYVVLKPNIAVPRAVSDDLPAGDDDALVRYAQQWLAEVTGMRHCKTRHVQVVVTSTAGHSVFLPRYVHPLAPPEHMRSKGEMAELCPCTGTRPLPKGLEPMLMDSRTRFHPYFNTCVSVSRIQPIVGVVIPFGTAC